jgi:hypothetical protein
LGYNLDTFSDPQVPISSIFKHPLIIQETGMMSILNVTSNYFSWPLDKSKMADTSGQSNADGNNAGDGPQTQQQQPQTVVVGQLL